MTENRSLQRIFGGKPVQVPPETNENGERSDYKSSNKSLVTKNAALKFEIEKLKNMINRQREELLEKDAKIALLESGQDEEKIDFLVAERFQKKLAHMNSITERTVLGLSKAAEEYRAIFCDMKSSVEGKPAPQVSLPLSLQRKPPAPNQKFKSSQVKPVLNRIQESPLIRGPPVQSTSEGSPPDAMNITIRRRTPKTGQKTKEIGETPGNKICSTPKARIRSTPTRPPVQPVETDTVRRKRTAASKITSFAEPSLNTKMRRPGRYDEPTPFISTDFM